MMAQLYTILGVVAVLLVLSVFASKAAVKLGVPTLLFLWLWESWRGRRALVGYGSIIPALLRASVSSLWFTSYMRQDLTLMPLTFGSRCGLP